MDEQALSELKKFVNPRGKAGGSIIAAVVLAAYIVYRGIKLNNTKACLVALGFVILVAGGSRLASHVQTKKLNNRLNNIEQAGAMPTLLNDFQNGRKILKDKLILGNVFLIGYGVCNVIAYSEIRKVYQTVHSTNRIEDKRTLNIETVDGKIITLCKLSLRGKDEEEVDRLISHMMSFNGNIQQGGIEYTNTASHYRSQ